MTDFNKMAESLIAGDRRALSRAITLVESSREDHRKSAISLISFLEKKSEKQAIRIGLSGTPGVGKSTFIEVFGSYLTDCGLRCCGSCCGPQLCQIRRVYTWR